MLVAKYWFVAAKKEHFFVFSILMNILKNSTGISQRWKIVQTKNLLNNENCQASVINLFMCSTQFHSRLEAKNYNKFDDFL